LHARLRVRLAPGFPCALCFLWASDCSKPRAQQRREIADSHPAVIARRAQLRKARMMTADNNNTATDQHVMGISMQSPREILGDLWTLAGGEPAALDSLTLSGEEPQLPSSFRVAAAVQASIAAAGLAAAQVWKLRSGQSQDVAVDLRHAVVECRSERYLRVEGKPPPPAWDAIAGIYRTRDQRFVRLHTNFPHHRAAVCKVLNCKAEREDVQAAVMQWDGEALETAAYAAGGVVALMRSHREWSDLPQARALAALPPIVFKKIGEAAPKPWPAGDRPLAGVRVLDLSRVIAGPVAGRTLAVHGADVLLISGPDLPAIAWLTIDNGRGKLTSFVELKSEQGRSRLRELLAGGRYLLARLSSARARKPRLFAGGCRAHQSRHRLCVVVGLWSRRTVGGTARLRLAGAGYDWLQPCRGAGCGRRRPKGIARANARSCHRLSDGVWRDGREGAPGARRRQLARPRLAGADRAMVVEPRPRR
jgi:crotonobetainyl-CoA:carnitine CoA-transferase CaiB-like acyl-CoA transferase